MDRLWPNFIWLFILTRSTLGLLAVIFRKFVRELCPSIDDRITLPLNILRNSVLLLYAKHCSGAIVRFSYNSSLAHLCRRLIGKLIVYQSLLRPSVCRPPINIFKHLWNHWANLTQISYGDSLGHGNKVCSNGPGHMTKMTATPIYGKNPLKIFSRTRMPMTFGLGM